MVLDPIPQSLPVHFFGSRPQPPTSRYACACCHARVWSCTGCRIRMGCLKSQVSFRKRATDCRAVLQKFLPDSRGLCHVMCDVTRAQHARTHTQSDTEGGVGTCKCVGVCVMSHMSCHKVMSQTYTSKNSRQIHELMSDSQERSIHELI